MRIHVTQEDIDEGKRDDMLFCPIARACRRVGFDGKVTGTSLVVPYRNRPYDRFLALPLKARTFIYDFDAGEPVAPFDFSVNANDPREVRK